MFSNLPSSSFILWVYTMTVESKGKEAHFSQLPLLFPFSFQWFYGLWVKPKELLWNFNSPAFVMGVKRVLTGTSVVPMPDITDLELKPGHTVASIRKVMWFERWKPNIHDFDVSEVYKAILQLSLFLFSFLDTRCLSRKENLMSQFWIVKSKSCGVDLSPRFKRQLWRWGLRPQRWSLHWRKLRTGLIN